MVREFIGKQKLLLLIGFSVVLTMFSFIFGAPFIRVIHKNYGSRAFWLIGSIIFLVSWLSKAIAFAIIIGSIWMTLGIYIEGEKKGLKWQSSSIPAIITGSLFAAIGLLSSLKQHGITTLEQFNSLVKEIFGVLIKSNESLQINFELIIKQIPSGIIVLLTIALAFSLILERKVCSVLNLRINRFASQINLYEFRISEKLLWPSLIVLLLSTGIVGNQSIEIIAVNILNIIMVLFFFQGFSILEVFLTAIRAGFLTRTLAYIVLLGQVFIVLTIFGFTDYWVDYRRRLRKLNQAK